MPKAININGGLGRIVCALPALKILQEQEPETLIIMGGWEELFLSTGLNVVEAGSVTIGKMLEGYDVITPEPYYQSGYREGLYDMREAFARALGVELVEPIDYGFRPCPDACMKLLKHLLELPDAKGKPVAVIQVKASGENNIRDLNKDTTLNAVQALKDEGYFPVLIGDMGMSYDIPCYVFQKTSLTDFIALIAICDLFVGGDSAGMHIAKAFKKQGIIYLTSTAGIMYYPEWFIEFRHPDHNQTFEYPRLFRAEQKQAKLNAFKGVNQYYISTDLLRESIQKIRG